MLQSLVGFSDVGVGVIARNVCNTAYSRCCASENSAENQARSQDSSRHVAERDSTNQPNAHRNLPYTLSICRYTGSIDVGA